MSTAHLFAQKKLLYIHSLTNILSLRSKGQCHRRRMNCTHALNTRPLRKRGRNTSGFVCVCERDQNNPIIIINQATQDETTRVVHTQKEHKLSRIPNGPFTHCSYVCICVCALKQPETGMSIYLLDRSWQHKYEQERGGAEEERESGRKREGLLICWKRRGTEWVCVGVIEWDG